MVLEWRCHCIEDPEIAELFELEAARGRGCRIDVKFRSDDSDLHDFQEEDQLNCSDTF